MSVRTALTALCICLPLLCCCSREQGGGAGRDPAGPGAWQLLEGFEDDPLWSIDSSNV